MRRLSTTVPAVVATVVAVLTLSTGTALAHGSERGGGNGSHGSKAEHGQRGEQGQHGQRGEHGDHGDHGKKPKRARSVVTLVGVISDTPTATIGSAGDTATSTITLAVKGGERAMHAVTLVLTLDSMTVVRKAGRAATAADLVKGDRVSARVRRMPDGSLLALRVNAGGRSRDGHDDD